MAMNDDYDEAYFAEEARAREEYELAQNHGGKITVIEVARRAGFKVSPSYYGIGGLVSAKKGSFKRESPARRAGREVVKLAKQFGLTAKYSVIPTGSIFAVSVWQQ